MANKNPNLPSLFSAIADAIRSKDGSTEPIVASTFPSRILALDNGYPDGEEWTQVELPWDGTRISAHQIVYGAGKYVILVNSGILSYSKILYSTDLSNWTTISLNGSNFTYKSFTNIVYGLGKFVLMNKDVGMEEEAEFACTSDFVNWTFSTTTNTSFDDQDEWVDIIFAGNKFIARCWSGVAAASLDGVTWYDYRYISGDAFWSFDDYVIYLPSGSWDSIQILDCYDNTKKIVTSYTYPDASSYGFYNFYSETCYAGNGKYICMLYTDDSLNALWIVYDGITWSTSLTTLPTWFTPGNIRMVYGNNKYLLTSDTLMGESRDGLNWTFTSIVPYYFHQIIYGNGVFVGIDTTESIATTKLMLYYSRTSEVPA